MIRRPQVRLWQTMAGVAIAGVVCWLLTLPAAGAVVLGAAYLIGVIRVPGREEGLPMDTGSAPDTKTVRDTAIRRQGRRMSVRPRLQIWHTMVAILALGPVLLLARTLWGRAFLLILVLGGVDVVLFRVGVHWSRWLDGGRPGAEKTPTGVQVAIGFVGLLLILAAYAIGMGLLLTLVTALYLLVFPLYIYVGSVG